MRKSLLCIALLSPCVLFAQSDSVANTKRTDSIRIATMFNSASHPLIKSGNYTGVLEVPGIDEKPTIHGSINMVVDFVNGPNRETATRENESLEEIARTINLHIAAGYHAENLHVVVVTHGPALFAVMKEEGYQKKFGASNPNAQLIKDLSEHGARFVACGQAMNVLKVNKTDLDPALHVALSAKTTISDYVNKGYQLIKPAN